MDAIATVEPSHERLLGHPAVREAIEANILALLLLDGRLNVVAASRSLLASRGLDSLSAARPMQPGDLLGCREADAHEGGCGHGELCPSCAIRTAARTGLSGEAVDGQARFSALNAHEDCTLRLSARSLEIEGERFVVVVALDDSSEVRRQELEHIFLHDLKNLSASLAHLDLLEEADGWSRRRLVRFVKRQASLIEDEIEAQRQLVQVASEALQVSARTVLLNTLVQEAVETVSSYPQFACKAFHVAGSIVEVALRSDATLIRRIAINLLKNAAEAGPEPASIHAAFAYCGEGVELSVHNPEVIPPEHRAKLFERYYSTKGPARGLGCWSARLLAEHYLRGSLTCASSPGEGTTFTLRLPLRLA